MKTEIHPPNEGIGCFWMLVGLAIVMWAAQGFPGLPK
jgi:hypothetical protein